MIIKMLFETIPTEWDKTSSKYYLQDQYYFSFSVI